MSSCLSKTGALSVVLTVAVCCDAPLRKWTNTEGRSFSGRISIATVKPQNTRFSGATSLLKFRFLNYVLRIGEVRTPIAVKRNTNAISLSFVHFLQSGFAACVLTSIRRIITKARSFSKRKSDCSQTCTSSRGRINKDKAFILKNITGLEFFSKIRAILLF